ncbi:hypothetical protein DRJ16_06980 [Candidatus Woesearchaeota archaeon]|nr:MAG: hypothetical protein DRJ16_06980 [Candidatus Woesearchaeota archaeon]
MWGNREEDINRIQRGQGRMGRRGLGPGGFCKCLRCGTRIPHQRGTPCYTLTCPNCGARMVRE